MRRFLVYFALSSLACSGLNPAPEPPSETEGASDAPTTPNTEPSAPLPSGSVSGGVPEWAGLARCGTPQILSASAALQQADATTSLEDGMLLCEVRFTGTPPKGRRWDAIGGNPDPALQINDRSSACAQNTHDATLSWHSMSLSAGEKLKVIATDIDIQRDDHAGMDITTFEGFPVRFQGDHFSATCSGLTAATVAARLPARVEAARAALSTLQQAMAPVPTAEHWGWPESAESIARRHIEDVAGHTGWQDDDVTTLLSNEAGLQAQWAEDVAVSIAQTAATLPKTVELGDQLSVSASALRCEDGACDLTLQLHNQGTARTLSPSQELDPYLVSPIGRDLELSLQDGFPDGLSMDPGAQTSLHYRLPFDAPEQGSVLRIRSNDRSHLLRISGN